ncbi:hypothetical protein G9A89_008944 [Geosiphon pyriformis]|nr:hypothetical protein G9A89_008944 [Geosiphon pyriformis]
MENLQDFDDDVSILLNMLNMTNILTPSIKNPEDFVGTPRIGKNGQIRTPRPQNAFFIFRKNVLHEARLYNIQNMRLICKVSSILWKRASNDEKQIYRNLALQVADLHHQRYPDFKYTEGSSQTKFRHISFRDTSSSPPSLASSQNSDLFIESSFVESPVQDPNIYFDQQNFFEDPYYSTNLLSDTFFQNFYPTHNDCDMEFPLMFEEFENLEFNI